MHQAITSEVVPGRLELPTSTLSVWRSNHLSYRTGRRTPPNSVSSAPTPSRMERYIKPYTSMQKQKEHPAIEYIKYHTSKRSRKEVFQPHLPVRLPCYDLAPITGFTLGRPSRSRLSGTPGFHGLTGGVYKARERIHRAMADARLLANPASWSRVADSSPN